MDRKTELVITIVIVVVIIGLLAPIALTVIDVATADYQISTESYEDGTSIVGKRFTRPDTYELCYREQFENGIVVERWIVVDKEDYLAWEGKE